MTLGVEVYHLVCKNIQFGRYCTSQSAGFRPALLPYQIIISFDGVLERVIWNVGISSKRNVIQPRDVQLHTRTPRQIVGAHFAERNVINALHGCLAKVSSLLQHLGPADRERPSKLAIASRRLYLSFVILPSINSFFTDRCPLRLSIVPFNYMIATKSQTPLHGHRLRTPPTNTTNGQKFATSQHLDMSRCWALALRSGKFVVELL